MIFDRFFDHFSIIKNRHAGMRIQFLMSDMASGNQNLIFGSVTKDIQAMDQKHRIFSMKIRDFRCFFVHFLIHCKSGVLIFCRSKSAAERRIRTVLDRLRAASESSSV